MSWPQSWLPSGLLGNGCNHSMVVTLDIDVFCCGAADRNGTAGAGPSGEAANGGAAAANGQRAAPLSVTSREWESCKLKVSPRL